MGAPDKYQPFFDEPRLNMTAAGRMFVRVAKWVGYVFFVVATLAFIFSEFRWMQALGILFLLVLSDIFLHRREADRVIAEMPTAVSGKLRKRLPKEGRINLAHYISPVALSYIEDAFDRSSLTNRDFFMVICQFLLKSRVITEGLQRLDVDPKAFRDKLDEFLEKKDAVVRLTREERKKQVETLTILAFSLAYDGGHRFIEPEDLFAALSKIEHPWLKQLFVLFEVDPQDLERALILSRTRHPRFFSFQPRVFMFGSYRPIRHRIMNRAWTSRPTPVLDSVSTDLTDLARQGYVGFLIDHTEEYDRLVNTLSRPVNPNALLVGDVGIGKQTIIEHLALDLTKDKVPQVLFDKRLVELHISNLVAGSSPEVLQKKLEKIVEEIYLAGNIILYIPDAHNLLKTSGSAYLSAADALMPIVMNNIFPVIGTTEPREFKSYIEPRSDFVALFEVIPVQELRPEEAEKVLAYSAVSLEQKYGLTISFGAIKKAVLLGKKYLRIKRPLPGSAEELLKDAVLQVEREGGNIVGPDAVIRVAERKVQIPIHEAGEEEAKTLLNFEAIIHERYINQDEAVKAVADALREYRSGLARKGGPIATFLFLGPTGVGKTELAKMIARIQFGSEKLMLRFDMTEYQNKDSLYRLIGSPDGTMRGSLTEAVREKPYAVVLLDEFEKAHPDILNVFLQVFDDGRLTDNFNRVVNFENTIIIATSNAHSDIMVEALREGQTMSQIAEYLKARLTDVFKPELLNRFTRTVVFRDLGPKEMRGVVELNLKEVARDLDEQGITIVFEPGVVEQIARLGYDPSFGARPLRRAIEEHIRAPLAEKILKKEIVRGSKARATLEGETIQFILEQ